MICGTVVRSILPVNNSERARLHHDMGGDVQVLRAFKQPFDCLDCLFSLSVALWVSWAASDMFKVILYVFANSFISWETN